MAFVVVVRARPRSNIVHIPAATEKQSWWIFFSITFIASLNESARIQIRTAFVQVWTVTHCLGLGHETMVCAVCLSIFLWSVIFILLELTTLWRKEPRLVIGIDHDTVCAGVIGTAIRHSMSCAGRRAAACGPAGRHNECCAGLQYQPRQRRPYKWSISILPRS